MEIYEVLINGRQYAKLEKMLSTDRARKLAMNQLINGYELFDDMLHEVYAPVADGWSTLEIVLSESTDAVELLRFITKQMFPNDEDYFLRQLGNKFHCGKDFAFRINLKF